MTGHGAHIVTGHNGGKTTMHPDEYLLPENANPNDIWGETQKAYQRVIAAKRAVQAANTELDAATHAHTDAMERWHKAVAAYRDAEAK